MDTISVQGTRKPLPRYCPRDYCAEPESFGYARTVRWILQTDERSKALSIAAQMQHIYAVRIRQRAKFLDQQAKDAAKARTTPSDHTTTSDQSAEVEAVVPGKALKMLAAKTGASYPRLLRALRGEVVLRLDDIAWADMVLGQISEFTHPRTGDGRPQQRPTPAMS